MYLIVGKTIKILQKKRILQISQIITTIKKQKCSRKTNKQKTDLKAQLGSFRTFGHIFVLSHKTLKNNIT